MYASISSPRNGTKGVTTINATLKMSLSNFSRWDNAAQRALRSASAVETATSRASLKILFNCSSYK
ncbi:hypothetical protein D3C81_2033990 [compost metagenome]